VLWVGGALLIAKVTTLSVPFTFKWAIDALNWQPASAPVAASTGPCGLIGSPLLMTISYTARFGC